MHLTSPDALPGAVDSFVAIVDLGKEIESETLLRTALRSHGLGDSVERNWIFSSFFSLVFFQFSFFAVLS